MNLPLQNGQSFIDLQGRHQTVAGEITNPGTQSVCWTLHGEWFRRADGIEVTGAYRDDDNNPVTIAECFKLRMNNLAKK